MARRTEMEQILEGFVKKAEENANEGKKTIEGKKPEAAILLLGISKGYSAAALEMIRRMLDAGDKSRIFKFRNKIIAGGLEEITLRVQKVEEQQNALLASIGNPLNWIKVK